MTERIYGYLQFMSTRTDDDSGIDLLLFVALQVSTVWTSSRLKFCITISLRVTPLRSTVIRLVTNLSLRYQDTVGAGLPTEIHQFRFSSLRVSQAEKLSHPVSTKRGGLFKANARVQRDARVLTEFIDISMRSINSQLLRDTAVDLMV